MVEFEWLAKCAGWLALLNLRLLQLRPILFLIFLGNKEVRMKQNDFEQLMMEENPTFWDTAALSAQGFFGLGFLSGLLIFLLMLLICTLAYFITR
jgi:hypothetical protein